MSPLHVVEGTPATAYGRAELYALLAVLALGVALGCVAQAAAATREVRGDELRARKAAARAENEASDAREQAERARSARRLVDDEPGVRSDDKSGKWPEEPEPPEETPAPEGP